MAIGSPPTLPSRPRVLRPRRWRSYSGDPLPHYRVGRYAALALPTGPGLKGKSTTIQHITIQHMQHFHKTSKLYVLKETTTSMQHFPTTKKYNKKHVLVLEILHRLCYHCTHNLQLPRKEQVYEKRDGM